MRFDLVNEPQPDVLLRLDPAVGGNSWVDGDGYLQGAPELIVEIAAKSASYARRGVQEYLVFQMHERQVSWFTLRDGNYEMLTADSIFRSRVFPGLWLHAAAFWADNMATVLVVLQQGLTSPEHQAFLEELSKR